MVSSMVSNVPLDARSLMKGLFCESDDILRSVCVIGEGFDQIAMSLETFLAGREMVIDKERRV